MPRNQFAWLLIRASPPFRRFHCSRPSRQMKRAFLERKWQKSRRMQPDPRPEHRRTHHVNPRNKSFITERLATWTLIFGAIVIFFPLDFNSKEIDMNYGWLEQFFSSTVTKISNEEGETIVLLGIWIEMQNLYINSLISSIVVCVCYIYCIDVLGWSLIFCWLLPPSYD